MNPAKISTHTVSPPPIYSSHPSVHFEDIWQWRLFAVSSPVSLLLLIAPHPPSGYRTVWRHQSCICFMFCLFYCLLNVTCNDISVIYVTAHRCAGGLKKKFDLQSGSQRHRHFVGFFNVPVLAPTRDQPFYTVIPNPVMAPSVHNLYIPYIRNFSHPEIMAKMKLGRCVKLKLSPIFAMSRTLNEDVE